MTCPRLREDVHGFLLQHLKPTAPPIYKRMPTGMTMSAILCDQVLPYLVAMRGDPRSNLAACPVLHGGGAQTAATAAAAATTPPASRLSHREIDLLLARRYCWCLHVFFFEHAAAVAKANSERLLCKNVAAGTYVDLSADPRASTASLTRATLSPPPPPPTLVAMQKRLRQIDIWIDELIAGLKTLFVTTVIDDHASATVLRGVAELSAAFCHGKALADVDGFNGVVDRVVANGDVGALLPTLQSMGASVSTREWNYILLMSKGAGLLRDAVHLALAVSNELPKVKTLVWQAFPSLRLSSHAVPSDPQLADALEMLMKLGA